MNGVEALDFPKTSKSWRGREGGRVGQVQWIADWTGSPLEIHWIGPVGWYKRSKRQCWFG
jgi:hypothetical protein